MLESFSFLILEFIRLEREQWLPKEQLKELQWQRFKSLLKHAY